ncbi:MAG: oligosaccharide flippase family protein, partial [Eubacteriales bacterium]|nr:oligosaccharide flippase family protein [Eubacteriales bacterium]
MNPNDGLKNVALKAGFTYVLSNVMVKAITVITTPIFARIMTTEEYGTFQTFVSWYNLLLPFLTLNLTYSIGRAKIDFPDRLDKYLGAMLALSSIFSGAVFLLTVLLIRPVTAMLELTTFQTTGLMVYLFFANPILLYQNLCRYRYEYKQNIAIAWYTMLSTTILSLAFIYIFKSSNKADMRILGTVIPTVVLSIYLICKLLASNLLNTDIKFWKYGLQISLPLILHTVSMHILSQSDRIFITKIWGKTDTAFYSLAYTYGVLLGVFTSAVGEGWLPWFHDTYHVKRFDEINKNSKPLV